METEKRTDMNGNGQTGRHPEIRTAQRTVKQGFWTVLLSFCCCLGVWAQTTITDEHAGVLFSVTLYGDGGADASTTTDGDTAVITGTMKNDVSSGTYVPLPDDEKGNILTIDIPNSISYNGGVYPVTAIGDGAFSDYTGLETITFLNTSVIKVIGADAFSGCMNLETVTFPASLEVIGADAFFDCASLTSVTLQSSTPPSLGAGAFDKMPNIPITAEFIATSKPAYQADPDWKFYFPKDYGFTFDHAYNNVDGVMPSDSANRGTVTIKTFTAENLIVPYEILYRQRYYIVSALDPTSSAHTSITTLDLSATSIASIPNGAFQNGAITNITFPKNLAQIGNNAFNGSDLESVNFTDIQTLALFIGDGAFQNCTNLGDITLSTNLTIGASAFANSGLTTITLPATPPKFATGVFAEGNNDPFAGISVSSVSQMSPSGDIFSYQTSVEWWPYFAIDYPSFTFTYSSAPINPTDRGTVTIADVTASGNINVPDEILYQGRFYTVNAIDASAFAGKPVTTINLDQTVIENIPNGAFKDCGQLTAVTFPITVQTIGEEAFSGCVELNTIENLPTSLTEIKRRMFFNCEQLPATFFNSFFNSLANLTSVGEEAFAGCTLLTTAPTFDASATLGKGAFSGCTNLTTIALPTGLLVINESLFEGCENLNPINIPNGVTTIGSKAFYGCKALAAIDLPGSVSSIGDEAFADCGTLAVTLNRLIPPIFTGDIFDQTTYAFTYNPPAEEASYQASLWSRYVGNPEYDILFNHHEISGNKTATVIGTASPKRDTIKNITVPAEVVYGGVTYTVDTIDVAAFSGCYKLDTVKLESTEPPVLMGVFSGIPTTLKFICPDDPPTVRKSYQDDPKWSVYFPTPYDFLYDPDEDLLIATVTGPDTVKLGKNKANVTAVEIVNTVYYQGRDYRVTAIKKEAFKDCAKLSDLTLPVDIIDSIGAGAFSGTALKSITLPKNLRIVSDSLFFDCEQLTSIDIPDKVEEIGDSAFFGCTALASITLNSTQPPALGINAFTDISTTPAPKFMCWPTTLYDSYGKNRKWNLYFPMRYQFDYTVKGGKAVVIGPDSTLSRTGVLTVAIVDTVLYKGEYYPVDTIDAKAFYGCTSLDYVKLPAAVSSIGDSAFFDCTSLPSVTLPDSLTAISKKLFYNCKLLSAIDIPDKVTFVGDSAFSGCEKLATVHLRPTTVPGLGTKAFYDIPETAKFTCSNEDGVRQAYCADEDWSPYFPTRYDFTYKIEDRAALVLGPDMTNRSIGEVITVNITDSVYFEGAWYYVKAVKDSAFFDCGALANVTISDSVTAIGAGAFAKTALTTINLPDDLTAISEKLFYGCSQLKAIEIPASVTGIGDSAFYGCKLLTSVELYPTNVPSVPDLGKGAFDGISEEPDFTCPGSVGGDVYTAYSKDPSWNQYFPALYEFAYKVNDSGNGVIVTEPDIERIEEVWRPRQKPWNTVDIVDTVLYKGKYYPVTAIGDSAFFGCTQIDTLNLPKPVTSIGLRAFAGCTNLDSIKLPTTVAAIGVAAFSGCKELVEFDLPTSMPLISDSLFAGCSMLAAITIPSSITAIEHAAFYNCKSLATVTLESVTPPTLGAGAFTGIATTEGFHCPSTPTTVIDEYRNNVQWNPYFPIPYDFTYTADAGQGATVTGPNLTLAQIGGDKDKVIAVTIVDTVLYKGTKYPIKTIADGAFSGCTELATVTMWGETVNNITSIGDSAFAHTALETLLLPNHLQKISNSLFSGCNNLNEIIIPDAVVSIGDSAFFGCAQLDSIGLPGNIASIGDSAFFGCTKLFRVSLLSTPPLPTLGVNAFDPAIQVPTAKFYCPTGTYDSYSENQSWNPYFPISYPFAFTPGSDSGHDTVIVTGPATGILPDTVTVVNLPETILYKGVYYKVTAIGTGAFGNCPVLKKIELPSTITVINNGSFAGSDVIETVILHPTEPPVLGSRAFGNPPAGEFSCPSGYEELYGEDDQWNRFFPLVYDFAYERVDATHYAIVTGVNPHKAGLTEIDIRDRVKYNGIYYTVTTIKSRAFADNTGLEEISLPATLTSIGDSAFAGCSALESLTLQSVPPTFGTEAFKNVPLEAFNCYPDASLYPIYSYDPAWNRYFPARYDFTYTTNANNHTAVVTGPVLPENEVEKVEIVDEVLKDGIWYTVTTVKASAFLNCTALETVILPANLKSIGQKAFFGCPLDSVALRSTPPTLGANAFDATVQVPETAKFTCPLDPAVDSLYRYSLQWNPYFPIAYDFTYDVVDNIAIVKGLNEKLNNVDANVIIVDTVLYRSVKYPVKAVGADAFSGCTTLKSIIFPAILDTIGERAFSDCTGLRSVELKSLTPPGLGTGAFAGITNPPTPFTCPVEDPEVWEAYATHEAWNVFFNIKYDFAFERTVEPSAAGGVGTAKVIGGAGTKWTNQEKMTLKISRILYGGKYYDVTAIAPDAFKDSAKLDSIFLPATIETISSKAFSGTSLTYISLLSKKPPVLAADAFDFEGVNDATFICPAEADSSYRHNRSWNPYFPVRYDFNYTAVAGRATVTGHADAPVSEKSTVKIVDTVLWKGYDYPVKAIQAGAFSKSGVLTNVTIPATIDSIGAGAFQGCSALAAVTVLATTPPVLGDTAFAGAPAADRNFTVSPDLLRKYQLDVDWREFFLALESYELYKFTLNPVLPASALKSSEVPTGTITGLIDEVRERERIINIPEEVVKDGVTYIVTAIGPNAFYNLPAATTLSIPATVTQIGESAFQKCKSLTSVEISSAANLSAYMFAECERLKEVKLLDDIDSIANRAFAYCKALDTFTLSSTNPPKVGDKIFESVPTKTVVFKCAAPAVLADYQKDAFWGPLFAGEGDDITRFFVTFKEGEDILKEVLIDSSSVIPADSIPVLEPLTGYTLKWFVTPDNSIAWNFSTDSVRGPLTLSAIWTQDAATPTKQFSVTFNGDVIKVVRVDSSSVIPSGSIPSDPEREGYTFSGWSPDNSVEWDFSTPVTADLTLSPLWTAVVPPTKQFSVTFNGDVIKVVRIDSNSVIPSGSIPSDPVREGYTFSGWSDNSVEWDFSTPVTADLTLSPIWTPNQVTPPEEPGGGGNTGGGGETGGGGGGGSTGQRYRVAFMEGDVLLYQTTIVRGDVIPADIIPVLDEREDYTLQWFKAPDSLAIWDFTTPVTTPLTLSPIWIPNQTPPPPPPTSVLPAGVGSVSTEAALYSLRGRLLLRTTVTLPLDKGTLVRLASKLPHGAYILVTPDQTYKVRL